MSTGTEWGETLSEMGLCKSEKVEAYMVVFKRKGDRKIYWGGDMHSPQVARQMLPYVKNMVTDLKWLSKRDEVKK